MLGGSTKAQTSDRGELYSFLVAAVVLFVLGIILALGVGSSSPASRASPGACPASWLRRRLRRRGGVFGLLLCGGEARSGRSALALGCGVGGGAPAPAYHQRCAGTVTGVGCTEGAAQIKPGRRSRCFHRRAQRPPLCADAVTLPGDPARKRAHETESAERTLHRKAGTLTSRTRQSLHLHASTTAERDSAEPSVRTTGGLTTTGKQRRMERAEARIVLAFSAGHRRCIPTLSALEEAEKTDGTHSFSERNYPGCRARRLSS